MIADGSANCLDGAHVKFSWTDGGAPAANSVTSAMIVDGTVAVADHGAGSVNSAAIVDATIATADLGAGSVNSAAIVDATIVTADLANASVTTAKLAVPPRVAYVAGGADVTLTSAFANLQSLAITVGGAGSIIVQATGSTELIASTCNFIYHGISETTNGAPVNTQGYQNRGAYGAVGVATWEYDSFSTLYVDVVAAAGTYTYYFVGRDSSNSGQCDLIPNAMTALFIPS